MSSVIENLIRRATEQRKAENRNRQANPQFNNQQSGGFNQSTNQGQSYSPQSFNNRSYSPNFNSNNFPSNTQNPSIYSENFGRGRGRGRGNFYNNSNPNQYNNRIFNPMTQKNLMNQPYQNFNQQQQQFSQPQPRMNQDYSNSYQAYNPNNSQFNNNFQNPNQSSRFDNINQPNFRPPQRGYTPNRGMNQQRGYSPNRGRGYQQQSIQQYQKPQFPPPQQQQYQSNYEQSRGRDNYRGRGGRGRGQYIERGRGRGRGGRYNQQNEITDNRPMTSKQTEQRTKKFVNLNQPLQLKQYQGPKSRGGAPQKKRQQYQKKRRPQSQQQVLQEDNQERIQSQSQRQMSEEQDQQQQNEESASYYDEEQEEQNEREDQQQNYQQQQQQDAEQQLSNQMEPLSQRQEQQSSKNQSGRQESNRMCSTKEFKNRMKIFMENNNGKIQSDPNSSSGLKVVDFNLNLDTSKSFSVFQLNKKNHLPDILLVLKKFQRSANRAEDGQDLEQAYVPRNKQGLIAAMKHIKKQIIDADIKSAKQLAFPLPQNQKRIQFIQIYVFLWDRMRQMIKDITRLSQQSKHDGEIIQICEQITRFFILSINEGRKVYQNQLTFDDKMNKQSLVKVMTPLLGLYASSKLKLNKLIKQMEENSQQLSIQNVKQKMDKLGIYISPNQPQITSYAILFSEDYRKYLYQNIFVGLELHDQNPLYQSKQIQQVLNIKSALSMKNYEKYFDMLESEQYGYLMSCLMSLNIHQIRKDISEKFQSSFRYMEQGARKKGINSNYFRDVLHFTKNQGKQYQQFLRTVDGIKTNNRLITWNHQLPEDQTIYRSPAYSLDFKLKRKYFQNDSGKAQSKMSRVQIVSRSWKKSTYVEELIGCFLHQQYIPQDEIQSCKEKIQQSVNASIIDNSDNGLASPLNVSEIVQPQKSATVSLKKNTNQSVLENKLQQLNRKKFLQNFSLKLTQLFKLDQTKQQKKHKSIKNIINILLTNQKNTLMYVFDQLDTIAMEKIQKQIYLIKFQEFLKVKKQFQSSFKNNKNEFINEQLTPSGMSQMLKKSQKPKSHKKRPCINLPDILIKNKIKQFNFKIFIDVKKQQANYSLIIRILNNIFFYFTGSTKIFNKDQMKLSYLLTNDQNQYKINVDFITIIEVQMSGLNNQYSEYKQLFGADAIFYLQTKKSIYQFTKALHQFIDIRNCIKISQSLLPIAVIRFIDKSCIQFQPLSFKAIYQSQQFLKISSLELSSSLYFGINGFINATILKYRKRPNIQAISLNQIINQISLNGSFVESKLQNATKQQLFIAFQQYANLCFVQIFRLSRMYYIAAGLFTNWLDIISQIDGDSNQNHTIDELKSVMKRQHVQLVNLNQTLKIISPAQNINNKVILNKSDFSSFYFKILKKFDFENLLTINKINQIVQLLKIKQGKIQGDVYGFYKQLLTILGQNLRKFFIPIPIDFKFHVNPSDLTKKIQLCEQKIQSKIKQQEQIIDKSQKFKIQNLIKMFVKQQDHYQQQTSIKRNETKRQFKYQRAQWLAEAKKKIKQI